MNNKTTLSLLAGALTAASATAGTVVEEIAVVEERSFEASVSVGAHSDYIFRGGRFGTDLVDATVEVSTSEWGLDFTAGAWYGSFEDGANETDELDLYFDVSKDLGFVTANVGYIHYDLQTPNGAFQYAEVSFGVSKEFDYGINASFTYFLNVSTDLASSSDRFQYFNGVGLAFGNEGYSELAVSKSCSMIDGLSLDAVLGYYLEEGDASHLTISATYDYAISENATLSPYLAYVFELDGLERSPFAGLQGQQVKDRLFGGLVLGVSF